MKPLHYASIVLLASLIVACNRPPATHDHAHDTMGAHDDHEHGTGTFSHTLFFNDYELFVEFPALIAGHTSTFAAHFTRLSSYKPVAEGKLTVSLIKGDQGIRHQVNAPATPGIFRPSLRPKVAGTHKLVFDLEMPGGDVRFEIPGINVFATADEAAHASAQEENTEAITFLKEQAWKTAFATQDVSWQPFHSVIHTSARVKGQPQSAQTLNAQIEGQVNLFAIPGQSVKKGELLAVIAPSGIENNLNTRLKESRIAFEKSRADYLRTKPLAERQMVSQKEFLHVESQYKQDSMRHYQLANQLSQYGLRITSPIDGFISSVHVTNGQYVDPGTVIMQVGSKSQLLIEAFVNQSDFQLVGGVFDAHFSFSNQKEIITLAALNGKVITNNPFVTEQTTRIPVTFSVLNNGRLMPGMYLEAFLKTGKREQALVVPLSAVIEEQGLYYVFVQIGGETFVKRQVEMAHSDGVFTEITSGLSVGERIVTQGAFQIKLASMSGDLPLHGHTH
jgi:membrane fusion protein, heavy metal efflux system